MSLLIFEDPAALWLEWKGGVDSAQLFFLTGVWGVVSGEVRRGMTELAGKSPALTALRCPC